MDEVHIYKHRYTLAYVTRVGGSRMDRFNLENMFSCVFCCDVGGYVYLDGDWQSAPITPIGDINYCHYRKVGTDLD